MLPLGASGRAALLAEPELGERYVCIQGRADVRTESKPSALKRRACDALRFVATFFVTVYPAVLAFRRYRFAAPFKFFASEASPVGSERFEFRPLYTTELAGRDVYFLEFKPKPLGGNADATWLSVGP